MLLTLYWYVNIWNLWHHEKFRCTIPLSQQLAMVEGNQSTILPKKNKNYYVVGDAGFARPRNTLKIISKFF